MGFFEKLKQGLSKTASSISSVFTASELDDEFYDDLEESLILADLGMQTTEEAMQKLRSVVRERHIKTVEEAKFALREVLEGMMDVGATTLDLSTKPSVILVIGVNGVGKTTTSINLSACLADNGKRTLLIAHAGQKGAAVRGRYVPRGGGRSAGNLVEPRACGHHPAARGRGPRVGAL